MPEMHEKQGDPAGAQNQWTRLYLGLQSMRRKGKAVGLVLMKSELIAGTDVNQYESQAIDDAMYYSGIYLDAIGKTELMSFSQKEFRDLIEVIIVAFRDSLREANATDPPF